MFLHRDVSFQCLTADSTLLSISTIACKLGVQALHALLLPSSFLLAIVSLPISEIRMGIWPQESKEDNQEHTNGVDGETAPVVVQPLDAPPEGGYGWVVVFALALMNGFTWGVAAVRSLGYNIRELANRDSPTVSS